MANGTYGTPMVSSVMPNTTGMSTAPSTITITSPMVSPVTPVTPRVSSRAPLPMTQTQTSTITSTPTVSTVMSNPVAPTQTVSTPMTTTATTGPLVNRNMGLPLSSARPIEVTETTSNLEEIQNFPVIGRTADGAHFHQDPVSGQVYRMTEEFHQRIPEILRSRGVSDVNNILDLSTQFQEPRFVVSKNSLVSQVMEYVNNLEYSTKTSFFEKKQKSIYNEYELLYPEYDLPMSQINFDTNEVFYYLRPVNKMNNFSVYEIQNNIPSLKYTIINRFFVQPSFSQTISVGVNYYIPVNKFYNK